MGTFSVSVNEKLCRTAMKEVDSALDKVVKYMGSTGTKNNTTIIGCVEKLNDGFKDTKNISTLYKNFNTSLNTLKTRLKNIDAAFEVIDKII